MGKRKNKPQLGPYEQKPSPLKQELTSAAAMESSPSPEPDVESLIVARDEDVLPRKEMAATVLGMSNMSTSTLQTLQSDRSSIIPNINPSRNPDMGLVRDPQFWKRFEVAINQCDDDLESGRLQAGSAADTNTTEKSTGAKRKSVRKSVHPKDEWLTKHHKKKRRCRVTGCAICLVVMVLIAAAIVVAMYFEGKVKF